jgi:hypothetical protein
MASRTATAGGDHNLSDPANSFVDVAMNAKGSWSTNPMVLHVNKPLRGGRSHLPFGGLKKSKIGPKEMGAAAEFYTRTKPIYLDYS